MKIFKVKKIFLHRTFMMGLNQGKERRDKSQRSKRLMMMKKKQKMNRKMNRKMIQKFKRAKKQKIRAMITILSQRKMTEC